MKRMLFGKKKETPEEKQKRLDRIYAEMNAYCNQGKDKYDKLCAKVNTILASANKPDECNVVQFASDPYLFPQLESYQYFFVDWEIWRNNEVLYVYRAEVENYPEEYVNADAPIIAQIPISEIQHFRVEGMTYAETKITGGKVSQNRYSGKIKQTPIKSKTVQHDTRIVRVSVVVNGVVKKLDFTYDAFDVMCALIPEKEHN